jgi:hypothetical protein
MTTMTETSQFQATHTVEWAPFTLAEGVDEATLLAASDLLQRDFLSKQPGFLHRELLKGAANQWVDIIHWESRALVEQAMRNAQTSPVCHSYFALMAPDVQDEASGGISLFEQVQRYV